MGAQSDCLLSRNSYRATPMSSVAQAADDTPVPFASKRHLAQEGTLVDEMDDSTIARLLRELEMADLSAAEELPRLR